MYSATFIFAKRQFDPAFHRLDELIAQTAKALPGYLGEESWENPSTGLVSNVYYWASMEALEALIKHPAHLEAKAQQGQWLAGYQVIIAAKLRRRADCASQRRHCTGEIQLRWVEIDPQPPLGSPNCWRQVDPVGRDQEIECRIWPPNGRERWRSIQLSSHGAARLQTERVRAVAAWCIDLGSSGDERCPRSELEL
jgi:heme-degrading monooxygenase HmoA